MPAALPTPTPSLEQRFAAWEAAGPTGDDVHRAKLQALADALKSEHQRKGSLDVLFVCTHNSRRSHMGQLLGAVAAARVGIVARTFSGGTETTAFNPRAIAALTRVGFQITGEGEKNPHYRVSWSPAAPAIDAFSKTLDDAANPTSDFVAVMTCSQADAACPFVKGARQRVSVPYEDPKVADGTPDEAQRYDERVEQIGRDLAWVFRQVKG